MPFRVEVSPNNRAACKNKECKDNNIKILKGELRYATQITVHEHVSWTYKHWGCVTPVQVANLIEDTGGDTDMVDGYDEIPSELQAKIDFALKNGHIPDEDWKGDVEVNRPGQKGFRVKVKAPKKKKGKKADQEDDDDAAAEEESKHKKKRGRSIKDEDGDEDAPAPKKSKSKAKEAVVDEDDREVDEIKPKKAKKKAAVKEEDAEKEDDIDHDVPKPKKERGAKGAVKGEGTKTANSRAKRTSAKVAYAEDATDDDEAEAPQVKKSVPQKRGRKKKAVEDE